MQQICVQRLRARIRCVLPQLPHPERLPRKSSVIELWGSSSNSARQFAPSLYTYEYSRRSRVREVPAAKAWNSMHWSFVLALSVSTLASRTEVLPNESASSDLPFSARISESRFSISFQYFQVQFPIACDNIRIRIAYLQMSDRPRSKTGPNCVDRAFPRLSRYPGYESRLVKSYRTQVSTQHDLCELPRQGPAWPSLRSCCPTDSDFRTLPLLAGFSTEDQSLHDRTVV